MTAKEKRHLYYLKHKEKFLLAAKEWKKNNPEKVKKSGRKAQEKYRSGFLKLEKKNQELLKTYGISWNQYLDLYEKQDGSCALCKIPLSVLKDSSTRKVANVDHCHTTGKVRGLLCNGCNQALGLFKDNPTILRLAAIYLDGI